MALFFGKKKTERWSMFYLLMDIAYGHADIFEYFIYVMLRPIA